MSRRAAKIDANQPEIVKALLKFGCSVQSLAEVGDGCPDLLVGIDGHNLLLEVKDGLLPPSHRRFTSQQRAWHTNWKGKAHVVNSIEDALLVVGRDVLAAYWSPRK